MVLRFLSQFAWVSPYNYAENEPVGHIDLWGLQKVSAKIAGEWTRKNETLGVTGQLTYDIGNNGDFSFDFTFSNGLNWTGVYSKDSGSRQKAAYSKRHYRENMTIDSGIKVPRKLALVAIARMKNSYMPKNLNEAMALSAEELKANEMTMYALNTLEGLVEKGMATITWGYNGELGVANNGNGDYVRKLTNEYSAKFDIEFGGVDYYFKGPVILTYTEQQSIIPQYIRRPVETPVGGSQPDNLRSEYWHN